MHGVGNGNLSGAKPSCYEKAQVRPPVAATEITAFVLADAEVLVRHLTPTTPVGQTAVVTVDVPVTAVRQAPAT